MSARFTPTKAHLDQAFGWDVVNWSTAIDLWHPWLASESPLDVLEVGGREGGLSLLAARYGHRVLCSDLENPESAARPHHERERFSGTIRYAAMDALEIPFNSAFDLILFKSILGGIGRDHHPEFQQQAIDGMYRALKPGGCLLFAENLTGSELHRYLRRRFQPWGNSWRYMNADELREMLSAFTEVEMRSTGLLGTLGRNETQRRLLGKLDQLVLARGCPSSWHYLVTGYARKN